MELNNREIAILVSVSVVFLVLCLKRELRRLMLDVVRAFFNRHFLGFFSLAFLWMAVCVYVLYRVELWEYANLKTTIVWGVTFVFGSMFSLSKIRSDKFYFNGVAANAVKLTAVVVFVTSLYSFPLWVEILLVPFVAFVGVLNGYSSLDEKNALLTRLLEYVIAIVGVVYFGNAVYEMFRDFSSFANSVNFKDFFVPIILTLLFFPFLYLFGVYDAYDRAFAQIGLRLKDEKVASYAKQAALRLFRADVELMQHWVQELYIWSASSRAEIKASIISMKHRKLREQNPLPVLSTDGWTPRDARKFLYGFRLIIDSYKPAYNYDSWFGSSRSVEVGANFRSSSLVYYIRGSENAVRHLKLVLNVNSEEDVVVAEDGFRDAAESLLRVVFDAVPSVLALPLIEAVETNFVVEGRGVLFSKELYIHDSSGGYSRSISIYNDGAFCDELG